MPTIPANNNTGLYNTTGNAVPTNGNITTNNISATGNVTVGGYIIANGSITTNANFVGNLVGNVTGNITLGGGNREVIYNNSGVTGSSPNFTFNSTTNVLDVNGNIDATYFIGNGSQLTGLPASYGNANVVSLLAGFGSNTISTTGNISGGYILGNGSQLTGLPATYGNANVSAFLPTYTGNLNPNTVVASGNITGLNLKTSGAGGNITGANYVVASFFSGDGSLLTNLPGGGTVTQVQGAGAVSGLSLTGNVTTTGNLTLGGTLSLASVTGNISTTGNVTGGYIFGNGSQLTGIAASYGNAEVAAFLPTYTGAMTAMTGAVTTTANISGAYLIGNGSALSSITGANVVGTVSSATTATTAGTVTTAAQANITSVGTLTSLSVSGNVSGGNVSAVGNIAASYFIGNGSQLTGITAGGNGTVTSVQGAGVVSGLSLTGNVTTAGNLTLGGTLDLSALSGNISTTGNITGGYLIGNGSLISSITGANVTGTVANAAYATTSGSAATATTANTVTDGAQANITSVGTLTSLSVTGNAAVAGNVVTGVVQATNSAGLALKNSAGTTQASMGAGGGDNFAINVSTNLNGTNAQIDISPTGTGHVHIKPTGTGAVEIAPTNPGTVNNMVIGNATPLAANFTTVSTTGNVTAAGNVSGSYIFGNGSQLTGIAASYGNANVVANLAALGSNPVSTTGNITAGYFIGNGSALASITGANVDGAVPSATTAGTVTTAAQANITSVGVLTSLSSTGNITGANLVATGNVYAGSLQSVWVGTAQLLNNNGSPPEMIIYAATAVSGSLSATGNITGGNVLTGGIVSATGNITGSYILGNGSQLTGLTATAPGGSNTQIQYNNAGVFGGAPVFSFNNSTGNVTAGNIVIQANTTTTGAAQNIYTNSNQYLGNTATSPILGRLLFGSGLSNVAGGSGDFSNNVDINSSLRAARMVVADRYQKTDNGTRTRALTLTSFVDISGTLGAANNNSRIGSFVSELYIGGGNVTQAVPTMINPQSASVTFGTTGNATVGNTAVTAATMHFSFADVRPGSSVTNLLGYLPFLQNNSGNASAFTNAYGISPTTGGNAAISNFSLVHMQNGSGNGWGVSSTVPPTNYYFLNNQDIRSESIVGPIRQYQDKTYLEATGSGTVAVDWDNGTTQVFNLTGNTTFTFQDPTVGTTDQRLVHTVNMIIYQDATGRTVTLPTASTTYRYANAASTVSSTASSVSQVTAQAIRVSGATQYLITVSSPFTG